MTVTLAGITFGCSSDEQYNQEKYRIDGSHVAVYKFVSDSEADREDDVASATGCPAIGDASTIMSGARCISRRITEVDRLVWEVEAEFSQNYKTTPSDTAPWSRDPEVSWSFETVEEPLLFDAQTTTKAIQNSAGEGLPPISRPIAVPVLTISRYETSFSASTILSYVNFVNDATFFGASAGQALCSGISATKETQQGTDCWKVTYTFKFKMDSYGWTARILDQGSYYWTGTVGSSEKKPFSDDALNPIIGNLDGSGGKNATTTPVFVTFERYDEADFSTLSLT